jgi:hypothetical protein
VVAEAVAVIFRQRPKDFGLNQNALGLDFICVHRLEAPDETTNWL